MSYKSATTTRLLATHCVVCARALRDAKSVEIGMGPICRKKYGFAAVYDLLTDRKRNNVNKLIHAAGVAAEKDDVAEVLKLADKMDKTYKFTAVAARVRQRFVKIRVHRVADVPQFRWNNRTREEEATGQKATILRVWTPYSERFTEERRNNLRGRPCRENTDFGKFHWEFAESDGVLLMRVLAICFPGRAFADHRGKVSTVPTAAQFNREYAGNGINKIKTGGRR